MAASDAPDFSDLYLDESISDVILVLKEEEAEVDGGRPNKRPRTEVVNSADSITIAAHRAVLWGLSEFFRTKIRNWSSTGSSSSKPQVEMVVPAGQLHISHTLIKAMYHCQPDLSGLSQLQTLQLLQLADQYGVSKVGNLTASIIAGLQPEQLEWAIALAIYQLPDICLQAAVYQPALAAARCKLLHELGDLELVSGVQKAMQLLQLPFEALRQLLAAEETKVASEDTVCVAIDCWVRGNTQTNIEQVKQLAQLIRVCHCSPTFFTTVMCKEGSRILPCFSSSEIAKASALCVASRHGSGGSLQAAFATTIRQYPAWQLPARPTSAVTRLDLSYNLPLHEVQAAFERVMTQQRSEYLCPPRTAAGTWQGKHLSLRALVCFDSSSDPACGQLLVVLQYGWEPCSPQNHVRADYSLSAHVRTGGSRPRRAAYTGVVLSHCRGRGFVIFRGSSWAAVQQQLRDQGLVHDDGCLHLAATVTGFQ